MAVRNKPSAACGNLHKCGMYSKMYSNFVFYISHVTTGIRDFRQCVCTASSREGDITQGNQATSAGLLYGDKLARQIS